MADEQAGMFARRGEKRCRLFWTSKSKKIRQAHQLFRISRRARSRRSLFVSGQEVACQLAAELSVRGLQVTGEATYVDDIPLPANTLYAAVVPSTHAHAKLLSVDPSEAIKVSTACDSGSPLGTRPPGEQIRKRGARVSENFCAFGAARICGA